MQILEARVNWMKDYGNYPVLECLVDKIPKREELRYTQTAGKYWAEKDGYVSFFYHNPGDETGFGGQVFTLNMFDGSVRNIKGPWSSRCGVMNRYFPHSVSCTMTDDPKVWSRGYTFYSAHITLELAREAAKMLGVYMVCDTDEPTWSPSIHPTQIVKHHKEGLMLIERGLSSVIDFSGEVE